MPGDQGLWLEFQERLVGLHLKCSRVSGTDCDFGVRMKNELLNGLDAQSRFGLSQVTWASMVALRLHLPVLEKIHCRLRSASIRRTLALDFVFRPLQYHSAHLL